MSFFVKTRSICITPLPAGPKLLTLLCQHLDMLNDKIGTDRGARGAPTVSPTN